VDTADSLPNQVMCTLCLCVSIGCQVHDAGTDEMAIMWYENGRRYLDDDDWGSSLAVMQALALISIFHGAERPTTARHYLGTYFETAPLMQYRTMLIITDIALRIGEANNLSAYVNGASAIDDTTANEWIPVWGTIQRISRIGFAYPVTSLGDQSPDKDSAYSV
jgi:hypothetical protein